MSLFAFRWLSSSVLSAPFHSPYLSCSGLREILSHGERSAVLQMSHCTYQKGTRWVIFFDLSPLVPHVRRGRRGLSGHVSTRDVRSLCPSSHSGVVWFIWCHVNACSVVEFGSRKTNDADVHRAKFGWNFQSVFSLTDKVSFSLMFLLHYYCHRNVVSRLWRDVLRGFPFPFCKNVTEDILDKKFNCICIFLLTFDMSVAVMTQVQLALLSYWTG